LNITLLEPMESAYDLSVKTVSGSTNESTHCNELRHCVVHGIFKVSFDSAFKEF
jgi:hypothetical protein